MTKPITTISMDKRMCKLAAELIDLNQFSSFVERLEQSIREECKPYRVCKQ
jgi:hypothetical protein